jgi:hypothetical protein
MQQFFSAYRIPGYRNYSFKPDTIIKGVMKKNAVLISLCLFFQMCLYAQEDTIIQRIVLIGDAGQLTNGKHPVVDAVRKNIPMDKKHRYFSWEIIYIKPDCRMSNTLPIITRQELFSILNFL